MKESILFFIIILLANIIQGVTGFAGTILAMPFSLMLVGYETAVPVLNLLWLLSGIYVFVLNRKEVCWKELKKILLVMAPMIFVGIALKNYLARYDKAIYITLGVIVLVLAVAGLGTVTNVHGWGTVLRFVGHFAGHSPGDGDERAHVRHRPQAPRLRKRAGGPSPSRAHSSPSPDYALLIAAGVVHGMFVCGGPLLISYLSKRVKDSGAFRATISTVWIVLNGIIFVTHIASGMWTKETVKTGAVSIPFLLAGMFFGSILYKKMSRKAFMILTYILLFISGVSLLLK